MGGVAFSSSYLYFQSAAFQRNRKGKHNTRGPTQVLCGDDPPTIVDGYGMWQILNRPLRQGIIVPQGFNPAKLQFNVRFGIWDGRYDGVLSDGATHGLGWDTRSIAAAEVEDNIDDFHWFAGGNSLGGPSPVVYVRGVNIQSGQPVQSNLIPKQYHGAKGWSVAFVMDSGITWGASLRHPNGSRVYQEAAFTMTGYDSVLGTHAPAAGGADQGLPGGFFKTTPQVRTARHIASSDSSKSPNALIEGLARNICKNARNNPVHNTRLHLERRSIDWKLPTGIDVWVPSHSV